METREIEFNEVNVEASTKYQGSVKIIFADFENEMSYIFEIEHEPMTKFLIESLKLAKKMAFNN